MTTHPTRSDRPTRRVARPGIPGVPAVAVGFTVAPIVFGLDKFFNLLSDWPAYLAPWIDSLVPGTAQQAMYVVGDGSGRPGRRGTRRRRIPGRARSRCGHRGSAWNSGPDARAYAEMFTPRPFDLTTFPNDEGYDELVLARSIPVQSVCEHHLLPFVGVAHVGYLPGARILGLSKLARVVEFFALALPRRSDRRRR